MEHDPDYLCSFYYSKHRRRETKRYALNCLAFYCANLTQPQFPPTKIPGRFPSLFNSLLPHVFIRGTRKSKRKQRTTKWKSSRKIEEMEGGCRRGRFIRCDRDGAARRDENYSVEHNGEDDGRSFGRLTIGFPPWENRKTRARIGGIEGSSRPS